MTNKFPSYVLNLQFFVFYQMPVFSLKQSLIFSHNLNGTNDFCIWKEMVQGSQVLLEDSSAENLP